MKKMSFLNQGVGQICYVVENVDETIRHFYENFGIGDWSIYTYGAPLLKMMRRHGEPCEYKSRIALGYLGGSRVEFIQPLEGETVYSEFVAKHGYGVQHLGIYVPDIEAALAEARAGGLHVAMEGSGFGLDGDGYFAYLDTEAKFGTTLELIQRPLRRHEPESIYPPVAPVK